MFIVGGYFITHVHRSCSLQHTLFKAPKRLKNKGKFSDDFIQSLVCFNIMPYTVGAVSIGKEVDYSVRGFNNRALSIGEIRVVSV